MDNSLTTLHDSRPGGQSLCAELSEVFIIFHNPRSGDQSLWIILSQFLHDSRPGGQSLCAELSEVFIIFHSP